GVSLKVVGLQPDGLVEIVEGTHAVAEFEIGVSPEAICRGNIRAQPDRARKGLDGLAMVAGGGRLVGAAGEVLRVVGSPVARPGIGWACRVAGLRLAGKDTKQDGPCAPPVRGILPHSRPS